MNFFRLPTASRGFALLALVLLILINWGAKAAPTEITHCGQVVTTDAVMTQDLVCETGVFEAIAIKISASDVILDATMGCPEPPDPACIFSSNNLVSGNTAVGNFIDLFHRQEAVGNTWVDNKCQTKEGAEIPKCTVIFLDGFEFY